MTRFARAKGSKASNERKPEEATPWSEMRRSLLSKKQENVENKSPVLITKTDNEQKCSEWAPLKGSGESVLRQQLTKKNKEENKAGMMGEKKNLKRKKTAVDTAEEKMNALMNGGSKKRIKKQETKKETEGSEGTVKKSKRKRKKTADDSEGKSPNKKKKMEAVDAEPINTNKGEKMEVQSGKKSLRKKIERSKTVKTKKEIKENFQGKFSEKSKGQKKFRNKTSEKAKPGVEELIINGEKIEIVKFQGFYVTLEDAERLKKLRTEMKKQGIPRDKLEAAIKLERRRAEKALSRLKKSVCFHCRGHGHLLSNCPSLAEKETTGTGICYKCGSTEHSAADCKVVRGSNFQFAECFICKEQGHIARQCPDNPRGLYPQGGACRECGDVTHLKKDCPSVLTKKEEEAVTVGLRNDWNLECLDEEIVNREKTRNSAKTIKRNSTVKF